MFVLTLTTFFVPHNLAAKQNELARRLNVRVPEVRIDSTFINALRQVASSFKIPMGISWVKTPSSRNRRLIECSDKTVLEIIQAIAATEPDYEVRIADNIVHVATDEVPPAQNFLNLSISYFSAQGQANWVTFVLWTRVHQQIFPDPRRGYAADILGDPTSPKLNLKFASATVEQVLDAVAARSNEKIWIVTFQDNLNLTPSGFRRTQSLLSKVATLDQVQPVWDTFRWNQSRFELIPGPNSQ